MRRLFAMLLAMLLLAGCGGGGEGAVLSPEDAPVAEATQAPAGAEEAGLALIQTALGEGVQAQGLEVRSALQYRDETVVRYAQTYRGVEVYGASMVTVSGAEDYVVGTYFDLSEAFDDSFDERVEALYQVPAWMREEQQENGVAIVYDTDTLRPVIYPLEDGTAVLARQVQATLSRGEEACTVQLVCSEDGETWYDFTADGLGYEAAVMDGVNVVAEDGVYYAYDPAAKGYVFYKTTMKDGELAQATGTDGGELDVYNMYALGEDEAADREALEVLKTFAQVAAWYRSNFGHVGVDGQGGTAILVTGLTKKELGSIAANAGKNGYWFYSATTQYGETVADAPEILAHEYAHGVLKGMGILADNSQTGCLHEAIGDAFACLFDPEGDWAVGDSVKGASTRDIAHSAYTHMEDFRWDYQVLSSETDWADIPLGWLFEFSEKHTSDTSACGIRKYDNSMIVSHTLYNVWKDAFGKNTGRMGKALYTSLRYLPAKADYNDFRNAFVYAVKRTAGEETARRAGLAFDKAGIFWDGDSDRYQKMKQQDPAPTAVLYPSELLDMAYMDICLLPWSELQENETEGIDNLTWTATGQVGDAVVTMYFMDSLRGDGDAVPYLVDVEDQGTDTLPATVLPGMWTGKTYGQLKDAFALSALKKPQYGDGAAWVQMHVGDVAAELYFDDSGAAQMKDAVLYAAKLWKEEAPEYMGE